MALGDDESRGEDELTKPLFCARIRPSSKTEDLEKEISKRNDMFQTRPPDFIARRGGPRDTSSKYLALK